MITTLVSFSFTLLKEIILVYFLAYNHPFCTFSPINQNKWFPHMTSLFACGILSFFGLWDVFDVSYFCGICLVPIKMRVSINDLSVGVADLVTWYYSHFDLIILFVDISSLYVVSLDDVNLFVD